jgi:murein DD-endopeptidase MepM/ murein hydrolase activator NlpD
MPVEGGRVRELDRQGEGHFGARRARDNGRRLDGHGGIDIEAASGAQIVSPVDGVIEDAGTTDAAQSGRRAIVIRTDDGHLFRIRYVAKNDQIAPNTRVEAGRTPIGTAVDNATLYPGAAGLTNHIHMEVMKDGRLRNPRPFMRRD